GLIYFTTKSFARTHYWNYFKSKSIEYQKAFPNLKNENQVIYILNGKILKSNIEAELFGINDSNFIELTVISSDRLKNDFNISDKSIGVIVKTSIQK
ncbi:MAG TPA: hypothetical protein VKR53_17650, partial [Puia sp.]|nr:hypothetical protein [Puia sp.]